MTTTTLEPNEVRVRFQAHQWLAVNSASPRVALVTGLGGGKTWTGARWIIGRALRFPDSIHLATVNSYSQAQDLVIPALTSAAEEMGLDFEWRGGRNLPTLVIDLGDVQAEVRVRSTEKYDRLRGPEYGSWWADEIRDAKRGAVPVVIARLRCRKVDQPKYLWTTTPVGYDVEIYGRHRKRATLKQKVETANRFGKFSIDVYETPTGEALINCDTRVNARLRDDYPSLLETAFDPRTLSQERGGAFTPRGNLVYDAFARDHNVSALASFVESEPLWIALDFNVAYCVAVLIQQRVIDGRMRSIVVGEIVVKDGQGTPGVIDAFKRRFGRRRGDGRFRTSGGITIVGDASGQNRNSNGSRSHYALWTDDVECTLRVPSANGDVMDRIIAMNAHFCDGAGNRDFLAHPSCEAFIADCEGVVWHEKNPEPNKDRDPERTHLTDAAGYYVVAYHRKRIYMDTARLAASDKNLWSGR